MTAQILELRRPGRLQCSACGVSVDAACECGVAYVPAAERAAKAIAANPGKTNRAIAAELGVHHSTVAVARKSGGGFPPPESTAGNPAVEKRVGKDGKSYPAKRRLSGVSKSKTTEEEMPTQEEADESYQQTAYDHACLIVDDEMSGETRQRFFAHLKRKYHVSYSQSPSQRGDKGLPA